MQTSNFRLHQDSSGAQVTGTKSQKGEAVRKGRTTVVREGRRGSSDGMLGISREAGDGLAVKRGGGTSFEETKRTTFRHRVLKP